MAGSGDGDGLTGQLLLTDGAVNDDVVRAIVDAVSVNPVLDNGSALGVALGGNDFLSNQSLAAAVTVLALGQAGLGAGGSNGLVDDLDVAQSLLLLAPVAVTTDRAGEDGVTGSGTGGSGHLGIIGVAVGADMIGVVSIATDGAGVGGVATIGAIRLGDGSLVVVIIGGRNIHIDLMATLGTGLGQDALILTGGSLGDHAVVIVVSAGGFDIVADIAMTAGTGVGGEALLSTGGSGDFLDVAVAGSGLASLGVGVAAGTGVGGEASIGAGGGGDDGGVSVVVITGNAHQTDLSSGCEFLVLIALGNNSKQTDVLDLLTIEGSFLPVVIVSPFTGGDVGVGLAVGTDLDLVLKDGTIVSAGTGLVVQTSDLIVSGQLEVDPEVLGIGATVGGVPHGAEVVIQNEICAALSAVVGLVAANGSDEGRGGNSLRLVESGNDFLLDQDLTADGALQALGQTIGADGGSDIGQDLLGVSMLSKLMLLTNQTKLNSNGMTGTAFNSQQPDILNQLQRSGKLDFLPIGIVSPGAGGQFSIGLAVVADQDLVLGDVTVAIAALVTQSGHIVGTINSKVDPAVLGSVRAVTTVAGIISVPHGGKVIVLGIIGTAIRAVARSIVGASSGDDLIQRDNTIVVILDRNGLPAGNDSAAVGTLHTGSHAGAVQSGFHTGDLNQILVGMIAQNLANHDLGTGITPAADNVLAAQVIEITGVNTLSLDGKGTGVGMVGEVEDVGLSFIDQRSSIMCDLDILLLICIVDPVAAFLHGLQRPDIPGVALNLGSADTTGIQTGIAATGIRSGIHATVSVEEQLIFHIGLNFRDRLTEDIHCLAFSMNMTHGHHADDHDQCHQKAQKTLKFVFHYLTSFRFYFSPVFFKPRPPGSQQGRKKYRTDLLSVKTTMASPRPRRSDRRQDSKSVYSSIL